MAAWHWFAGGGLPPAPVFLLARAMESAEIISHVRDLEGRRRGEEVSKSNILNTHHTTQHSTAQHSTAY